MVKAIRRDKPFAELRFLLMRMKSRKVHTPAAKEGAATFPF